MARRKRDYRAEYRRRVARALAKGISRSQARGHRRAGERESRQTARERRVEDQKLQHALRVLRHEKNIAIAAKEAHLSPEKLRQFAIEKGILEKRDRRWVIKKNLKRRMLIYSNGREASIESETFRTASLIGKYMAGVRWFLQTNDLSHLQPFAGKVVKDSDGKSHLLETRPNVLHHLAHSGDSFEQVYRIVV